MLINNLPPPPPLYYKNLPYCNKQVFATGIHVHSSLIVAGKTGAYQSGVPCRIVRLLALPANIRLGRKWMPVRTTITTVKKFYNTGPGWKGLPDSNLRAFLRQRKKFYNIAPKVTHNLDDIFGEDSTIRLPPTISSARSNLIGGHSNVHHQHQVPTLQSLFLRSRCSFKVNIGRIHKTSYNQYFGWGAVLIK